MLHQVLTQRGIRKVPSKKFIQQIVRPWSFLWVPTIEASMNSYSLSLLPLTFPHAF